MITDFASDNNNSVSFKFKQKITGQTSAGGTNVIEIMVLFKYLSNLWEALEMSFN